MGCIHADLSRLAARLRAASRDARSITLADLGLGEGASGSVWLGRLQRKSAAGAGVDGAVRPLTLPMDIATSDGQASGDKGTGGEEEGGGEEVAVKIVRKEDLDDEEIGWLREEVSIHQEMIHVRREDRRGLNDGRMLELTGAD